MNHIIADESVLDFFLGLVEPVEVRDETGQVLGHYTPLVSPEEAALYEKAKTLFDPTETARILAEERGQGRPLEELWRQLQSRKAAG